MIVITAHLVSARGPEHSQELGRLYIVNDGTGSTSHATYKAAMCRKGNKTIPSFLVASDGAPKATRTATLERWPRNAKTIWQMVHTVLGKMYAKGDADESDG